MESLLAISKNHHTCTSRIEWCNDFDMYLIKEFEKKLYNKLCNIQLCTEVYFSFGIEEKCENV